MNGRWVVTRPDVPEGFDPADLIIPRTDEERDQLNAGIDRWVAEMEADDA